MNKSKILFVTNTPTPYRIPLLNELSRLLRQEDLSLTVVFAALGYEQRKWKIDMADCEFNYIVLSGGKLPLGQREHPVFSYSGIIRTVRSEDPAVILTTAFSIATLKLFFWSFFSRTPYIIWSGGIESRGQQDSFPRRLQRRMMVLRAKAFIAYGNRAKQLLVSLGADPERVRIAINTVDTEFFRSETERLRQDQGKPEMFRILYVGYLIKRKRVDLLLKAVHLLFEKRQDFMVDIVGDGPEADSLKALVSELGIQSRVDFHGYRQRAEIPGFMASASCFAFVTGFDVWGLVLVEAMAAGLPCIASVEAGATSDLIEQEKTGFALDFSDAAVVAAKIEWMLDNPLESQRMGISARDFIATKVNLPVSAQGVVDAVHLCLDEHRARKL